MSDKTDLISVRNPIENTVIDFGTVYLKLNIV